MWDYTGHILIITLVIITLHIKHNLSNNWAQFVLTAETAKFDKRNRKISRWVGDKGSGRCQFLIHSHYRPPGNHAQLGRSSYKIIESVEFVQTFCISISWVLYPRFILMLPKLTTNRLELGFAPPPLFRQNPYFHFLKWWHLLHIFVSTLCQLLSIKSLKIFPRVYPS